MKGSRKALLLGLMMAAGTVAAPTIASAGIVVDIDVAPPPVRVETVPEPRVGYVWAPGFWEWRGQSTSGSPAATSASGAATTGFPIAGSSAVRIGTMSAATGSAETANSRPADQLSLRGSDSVAPIPTDF